VSYSRPPFAALGITPTVLNHDRQCIAGTRCLCDEIVQDARQCYIRSAQLRTVMCDDERCREPGLYCFGT